MTTEISLSKKISNPNFLTSSNVSTIPKSKRFRQFISEVPGPGSYNVNTSSTPSIAFPRTKREPFIRPSENPGPGCYDIPQLRKGPQFTMPTSQRRSTSPISPGPGEYNVHVLSRPKSVVFARTQRKLKTYETEVPGPGHYSSRPSSSRSIGTFSKANRLKKTEAYFAGPGSYNLVSKRIFKFALSKEARKSPF